MCGACLWLLEKIVKSAFLGLQVVILGQRHPLSFILNNLAPGLAFQTWPSFGAWGALGDLLIYYQQYLT